MPNRSENAPEWVKAEWRREDIGELMVSRIYMGQTIDAEMVEKYNALCAVPAVKPDESAMFLCRCGKEFPLTTGDCVCGNCGAKWHFSGKEAFG